MTNPSHVVVGSDRGAERVAALYGPIETAKLNGLDPEAYLTDVLTRIGPPGPAPGWPAALARGPAHPPAAKRLRKAAACATAPTHDLRWSMMCEPDGAAPRNAIRPRGAD